jgi:hypothetical protein
MFHTVDLRLLRLGSRVGGEETFDLAAPHRRELAALLRMERRARWAAWAERLRSRLTGARAPELRKANLVRALCNT